MLVRIRIICCLFSTAVLVAAIPERSLANWVPLGPDGGPAEALLIDSADPQRILLSSTTAGLFESTDGAMTFAPLAGTPRTLTEFGDPNWLRTIVQSPMTPDIVLATDRNRSPGGWRSVDGGRNWAPIESFGRSGAVAFNSDGSRAYVISTEGLLASDDNGATWNPLMLTGAPAGFNLSLFVSDIVVSPALPNRVYVVSFGNIIRSDDGGASWQPLAPLPSGFAVNDLVVSDDPTETLFAVSDAASEIYASADNGASWPVEASGLVDPLGNPAEIVDLAIQYSTGTIFGLSEGRLHRSSGIGQPWTSTTLPARIDFGTGIHFDPQDSNRIFLTARSGLFESADGGASWQSRISGFRGQVVTGLTVNRAAPGTIIADSGLSVFTTSNTGGSWSDIRPRTLLDDSAFAPVSSASDPLTLHAVSADGIPMETTDGGASWTPLTAPSAFVSGTTLLIWSDPRDDSTLIAGDFGSPGIFDFVGLFQSTDAGSTWTRRFAPPPDRLNFQPNDLADDPTRPGTVFFGIHSRTEQPFTDGLILRSTDGGATFDNLIDGFSFAEVAVDSAGTVFAGGFTLSIRQGVWRSTDGGDTWEAVNNGIPLPSGIVDIAAHPSIPGRLAVSTLTELYETRDNGASWQLMSRIGLGQGNAIRSVEILPGVGEELELVVGTDSGVFFSAQASLRPSIPVPMLGHVSLFTLALLALLSGLLALTPLAGRVAR